MIIVEFIFRLKNKKRILQIGSFWLVFFLFLCIFASIIAGMRFGAISIFFMSFGILLILIIVNKNLNKKTKGLVSMFFLILCTLPLLYNAKTDKRWYSLIETIPIAIDTENYTYWRDNENPPVLKNGDIVDHSNYMRIAWAVRGIKYIKSDIFGIGYGKNVFGHAIQKYENSPKSIRGSHSHSGVIDFTIGVGILGLLLWLYFIGKIIVSMALMYANYSNYFSLFSLFFTSSFFIRSLVDSNMRDHMFKQFFLILGIVLTLAAFQNHKKNNDS